MAADHVIIGSGINGLVAAALLALKGDKVTVLEREDRLGGCLFTDQATLPGFNHDVMAATWVLFMTSPAGAALGPHLARHGFEYCHTPTPTAVLRPDGEALVQRRKELGFVDMDDFLASPEFAGKEEQMEQARSLLGQDTGYFLLTAEVKVADREMRLYSVLQREGRQVNVLARAAGSL